jgi:group I intron endonuclease
MLGFIIYKAENTKNGYVYVGATTKSLEGRKKDHLQRVDKSYSGTFQEAISTYGAGAFSWEQIDTAINNDELAQKEKEYILKYNSKEDGYNSDAGGGIQKTVYQYDTITGRLVNKYPNLTDAGKVINATKQDLSKVCLSVNKVSNGFYWSYEYKEPFVPSIDVRKKAVLQLTKRGEFVKMFESVSEASRQTGFNKSCIAKVCRGGRKSSGGYLWKFK